MPLGSPLLARFRIVNHSDQSVSVLANVKYHVSFDVVGVLECDTNLGEIVPSNLFHNGYPGTDLVCGIRILFRSTVQMLARNDVHLSIVLHEM